MTTPEERLADTAYRDILPPADATWVGEWEKNLKRDGWSRSLIWRSYEATGGVGVDIDGSQQCDGTFTRHISLFRSELGVELTAAQARELGVLLIGAAYELKEWQR